jgi:hypothetical protein
LDESRRGDRAFALRATYHAASRVARRRQIGVWPTLWRPRVACVCDVPLDLPNPWGSENGALFLLLVSSHRKVR